ncbi:hypothetical protein [Helicobacter turcicus]|uniref:LicD family protein n=1 Tax=Helicobacter turcicus TaxID=2867412 RepID=A0ABS7JP24_9HELI|nr:hypothetical protein [Helicobacter turcicus]MBX7491156.1 hypothetical protein [Helicobacter turcicus]MBX7546023.1 hypothetical protein [Helicobacter turcicus]
MTFKASLKKAFIETKGEFFITRLLCAFFEYYFQSLKTQKKAFLILKILSIFKQDISLFYKAKIEYFKGDFHKALFLLESLKPNKNPDICYLKARVLSLLGQKEQAFLLLEQSLKSFSRLKGFIELVNLSTNKEEFALVKKLFDENKDNFAHFQNNKKEFLKWLAQAAINAKEYQFAKQFLKESLFLFLKNPRKKFQAKQIMRTKDAKEALEDLAELLALNKITMFLISGVFLGCVRSKSFIEHDYDIDVGVFGVSLESLHEIFTKSPCFVLKNPHYQGGVQLYHLNGIYIDVFLHFEEHGFIYHDGDFVRWKNTAFELCEYEFLGKKYLAPKDYDLYLRENYGVTYMQSKNSKTYYTFLDTPNMQILNKEEFIICLYESLFKEFALFNETRILDKLKELNEKSFVTEYLDFKKGCV